MTLGIVAEPERLPDSPDTVAVVEPTMGATARSKGSLFVVVSGVGKGRKLFEATRLVADAIQTDYYYDESAGLVVCLEKSVRNANRKIAAQRDKLGLPGGTNGPLGLGVAVVRGNELYVVTSGPVEAYLVRQAHLLTLPDTGREFGLPHEDTAPEVWRGEISAGDSLVLASSNVTARLGEDELKDAVVTLHPQAAMEHLHHRFVAAGGAGSDGLLAIEATEVAATAQRGRLVPVHPAEPLAGQPDRSPIPLADSVTAGAAAATAGATRARDAAGSALSRFVHRLQDLLPRRGPHYRRVTPAATRRETQRRAAIAVLAFVVISAIIVVPVYFLGNSGTIQRLPKVQAGEKALNVAKEDVRVVFDNGTDLLATDPTQAEARLLEAYGKLAEAEQNGVAADTVAPIRTRVVAGLDRRWGMIDISPSTAFSLAKKGETIDLRGLVIGPDRSPYVLDVAQGRVLRLDLLTHKAQLILRAGSTVAGTKVGTPKLLGLGGPDVLVLDDKNQLWRWRPADTKGTGTLRRVPIAEATTWGSDIVAFSTFLVNPDQGLYNLFIADPSEQQVKKYVMVADGSGYQGAGTDYLTTPRDVSAVTSIYIDGDLYMANNGVIERYFGGKGGGWSTGVLPDRLLRPGGRVTWIASPDGHAEGVLYAFDAQNGRLVAFDKLTGAYDVQYRVGGGSTEWGDLRGFAIVRPATGPALMYWIEADSLHVAPLPAAPPTPPASPRASGSPGASGSPSASPSGSPKASPKATPKRTPRATRPTARP